ncbi:proline-rich protein 7, partial [Clarias magur]
MQNCQAIIKLSRERNQPSTVSKEGNVKCHEIRLQSRVRDSETANMCGRDARITTIMVMSQGTYTFLACFAGFWLIWALIVMVCCFCSFVQRKLKRRREERLREQCLRALEMEPLECTAVGYPSREPPQFCSPSQMMSPQLPVAHTIPQGNWTPPP